jgi:precorrin-2/cobalt-factor-2 C20-methyltransferase
LERGSESLSLSEPVVTKGVSVYFAPDSERKNEMTYGKFYGVGVGPGDVELMTLKALRIISENKNIALAGRTAETTLAYNIAKKAADFQGKTLIPLSLPMTRETEKLETAHRKAAEKIAAFLQAGESVVYLTLGDPGIYSSYSYLAEKVEEMGFETEMISGVPSFCAAAAELNIPLALSDEKIHILPSPPTEDYEGTLILMKSGENTNCFPDSKKLFIAKNCGLEDRKSDYFTIVIAKEKP